MADLSKDTLKFAEEFKRMCKTYDECNGCPLELRCCTLAEISTKIIDTVQKWSDEHPLKTYAQDFRDKFPNCAWWDDENRPMLCRYRVYDGKYRCINTEKECSECWNETMPEE